MKLSGFSRAINSSLNNASNNKSNNGRPAGIDQSLTLINEGTCDNPKLITSIRRRVELLDKANNDLVFRAEQLQLARADVGTFINNWAWTYDPRRTPATIPFDLFPKQEEFLIWLSERIGGKQSGVVEKSRDTGLTWMCFAFALHRWLFVPGAKIAFGSRKAELVDKLGDPDSIFEKGRMLLRNLPEWMLPQDYSEGLMKFINRDNGNSITGEGGDEIGRGGRSSIYFLDEFAFVSRAERVDAAVSQNSDVLIYVSTPNGPGNAFAKKRHSGRYPVFRIHWRDDGRKDQAWYEKQKATLDPVILAQEIDIDYNASIEGILIPSAWVMAAVDLKIKATGKTGAGLDIADEGGDNNVLVVGTGAVIREIKSWKDGNTTQTAYTAKMYCEDYKIDFLNYDSIGVGAGVGGTLSSIQYLKFKIRGINSASGCSDRVWAEFDGATSKELFANLRAEMWWSLRRRFEKTYEHVNKIKFHPESELISIPNHSELIAQLSAPLRKFTDTGKILIESKKDMKKRGISSPDYADALAYYLAPPQDDYNLDWLTSA